MFKNYSKSFFIFILFFILYPKIVSAISLGYSISQKDSILFDLIIKNGFIYDGSGGMPYKGDLGIINDKIEFMGDAGGLKSKKIIFADDKVVSPGFINMLSWAVDDLIIDVNLEIIKT